MGLLYCNIAVNIACRGDEELEISNIFTASVKNTVNFINTILRRQ